MAVVTVTTDSDSEGFQLEVEPIGTGGWLSVEPGFNGFGPGQVKKVYVDGAAHWAQRRWTHLALIPDS